MKSKAVLIVALIVVCFGNAFAQQSAGQSLRRLQRQGQEVADRDEHCSAVQGVPGVTAPLIPFEAKDKIKYEDAVERAKKNDPEAYYWLAYYFAKGEGVKEDRTVAGKFLQKAVDLGHVRSSYLMGVFYERFALTDENGACVKSYGMWGRPMMSGLLSDEDIDELDNVLADCHFSLKRPASVGNLDSMCYTNDVVAGYVRELYSTAARGGLSYATNCIARLNSTIVKCRERIAAKAAAENAAKERASVALSLLADDDEKRRGEEESGEKLRQKQEEKKRQQEERDHQREYWSTWPRDLSNEEYGNLLCDAEKKYDSVILGLEYLVNSTRASSTNTWNIGCGRNLIKADECFVRKIDKDGRVVWLGGSERANDVEEIRWYNEERSRLLEAKRVKWAEEHGMTVEEASRKYDEWSRRPRSLLGLSRRPTAQLLPSGSKPLLDTGGSLRERRAARDQARQEELAKEKELEVQREALERARAERERGNN